MRTEDFIVLGAYLLLLGVIAWRFRRSPAGKTGYFLGGRSFGALPVGLSVMVTTFSAVNYLALPGEVYGYGLYVLAALPAFFLAAWPVTRFWMPFFRRIRAVSVYAFLEDRFSGRVRTLCSLLFLIWRLFWMAIALYASARILSLLTGSDFLFVLLLCGVTAAVYSAFGGMKAVVWTDVMQFCVLFGSILLSVILACRGTDFLSILPESGRLRPFYPPDLHYLSPDAGERITLWSALIGTCTAFLTRFGADQMVMQRYLAAKDLRSARRGLWVNAVSSTVSLGLLAVFGLALCVFARRNGLPAGTPPLRVIGKMLQQLPPGCTGMVAAGLLAATMSSIDSGLNSCTAAITVDFLERFSLRRVSPVLLTLLLSLPVLAAAAYLLPLLNREQTLFMILNKTVNAIGTPLLGVMLCALFWKRVRENAVFYGTLAGGVCTVFSACFIRHLALHYYAVLSLLVTLGSILVLHGTGNLFKSEEKK